MMDTKRHQNRIIPRSLHSGDLSKLHPELFEQLKNVLRANQLTAPKKND